MTRKRVCPSTGGHRHGREVTDSLKLRAILTDKPSLFASLIPQQWRLNLRSARAPKCSLCLEVGTVCVVTQRQDKTAFAFSEIVMNNLNLGWMWKQVVPGELPPRSRHPSKWWPRSLWSFLCWPSYGGVTPWTARELYSAMFSMDSPATFLNKFQSATKQANNLIINTQNP